MSSPRFPLLALDAATAVGTVALFTDATRSATRVVPMGASREDGLLPAIDVLCRDAGIEAADIATVVCGAGPGSFTSLRIAGSIAKGIAHTNGAALYSVSSLLLAAGAIEDAGEYLVHSDAMRGERFMLRVQVAADGVVRAVGDVTRAPWTASPRAQPGAGTHAPYADKTTLDASPATPRVAVVSDASDNSSDLVVQPDASRLLRIPEWLQAGPIDLASWEPSYGRLAEAQVKWEAAHGVALPSGTP